MEEYMITNQNKLLDDFFNYKKRAGKERIYMVDSSNQTQEFRSKVKAFDFARGLKKKCVIHLRKFDPWYSGSCYSTYYNGEERVLGDHTEWHMNGDGNITWTRHFGIYNTLVDLKYHCLFLYKTYGIHIEIPSCSGLYYNE